jgi:hypothetical protein
VTLLVLVPLALVFAWFCRFGGRRDAADEAPDPRPPARPVAPAPPRVDPIAVDIETPAWTALDDIQLDRLLKESSP